MHVHLPRLSLAMLFLACLAVVAHSAPVEATAYGRAVLRIEARPQPQQVKDATARRAREQALADAGVQARWIQVVDNWGGALMKSPYLPCAYPEAEQNEAILRQWVAEMHEAGMAVMSWYPLTFCQSGWRERPDWRQVYIVPWRPEDFVCCIETGYGDALIRYADYAIERLGLDGIWFDGSVWTPIWERPVPLTCGCAACRAKFLADTGLELPSRLDWEDSTFRAWVHWRYREFGDYIGRLAGAIREKHPDAAVVINHYHRPGIPWQSAVPIDRYDADIISGSEAFSPDSLDLTMRLCRAYGRGQSEVWRPFSLPATPEADADSLLQHALLCYQAGGYPSFGGDLFDPKMAPTAALMSPVMEGIHPWVGGESLPYAALNVSQQTETFFFGRGGVGSSSLDPYFASLGNWTAVLGAEHVSPDYVYDADFRAATLSRYRVLFMPLSLALTDAQARTAVDYARSGGTLVLGPGAGQLNADGQPRDRNPLAEALGFVFDGVPAPDASDSRNVKLWRVGSSSPLAVAAVRTPLRLVGREWEVLYRYGEGDAAPPAIATRPYGKGRVTVVDADPSVAYASNPASGGETRLGVSDETAAGGRYSLKYEDAPIAPQPFYPDLENRFLPFAAPEYVGGELSCDLRVGAGAHVSIEVRSSVAPIEGPIVGLGPQAKVWANGQAVCDLPDDRWIHLRIAYDFAAEGKPPGYEVTVTLPGGEERSVRAAAGAPQYHRTDWLVVYGAGTERATFYLDNLQLVALGADGTRRTALSLDFEEGPEGLQEQSSLVRELARIVCRQAPPPVTLDAPDYVRMGVYRRGAGEVLVHLHDRNGLREHWQRAAGPAATLSCDFPVRTAELAVSGQALAVKQRKGRYEVSVGPVGLYRVVRLRR